LEHESGHPAATNEESLRRVVDDLACGRLTADDAFARLKGLSATEDLGFARVDHGRASRNGFPEVIFSEGKKPEHIAAIAKSLLARGGNLLATRADETAFEAVRSVAPDAMYHADARIVTVLRTAPQHGAGRVAVVSAGTADLPVAEEAAVTAEALGNRVDRYFDVGVAGIHRLFSVIDRIREAEVVIVVAGMEGALASVLGGLVDRPVFAVPSGVGYGANFDGLATLLAMLNCCASGVSVMNIGNGFGAGYMAATICRMLHPAPGG
jgi:pyridinium-3,5-biscarboxylic acid mononucleotide synthase